MKKIQIYFERSPKPDDKKRLRMLIASPSPRQIPAFDKVVDEQLIPEYDFVWFKFWPQSEEPYRRIREYFLKRKNYTHLAILPDDLIVNIEGVNKLVDLVLKDPHKYTVLMGNCFVEHGSPFYIYTIGLPSLKREERKYNWANVYRQWQLKELQRRADKPDSVLRVSYSGTAFAIFAREVMEKISFATDIEWNRYHGTDGSSEDVVMAHDLAKHKIFIHVDTDVMFEHLKGRPESIV